MSAFLSTSIMIPLILGFVFLIPKLSRIAGWTTAVLLAVVTGLLAYTAIPVWSGETVLESLDIGKPWLELGLLMDNLSTLIVLLISVIGTVTAFYSIKYMEHANNKHLYFSLYNFFFAGMIGVVLSTNLIEFFFFWELMLIPSYLLIIFWGTKDKAAKIGLKYFFYTQTGSIGIIVAFGILGAYGGGFGIAHVAANLATSSISNALMLLSFILMMFGFAVKMAVFPFQNWLPDAHGEAPTPISVLLSAVMIETASYAIVRMGLSFFTDILTNARFALEALGAFTLIYGGFLALRQTDVKRLLAYSSVSQMGYVFFGIATYNTLGVAGGLFHILAHGFGKGILFMIAGILMHELHTRDITQMGGLGSKMPVTSVIAFIGALNLAGVPPLSGFFSEWLIFTGAIDTAKTVELTIVTIILLLGSILSAAYMLRFLWKVFLGPLPEAFESKKEPSPSMWLPAGVLALLAVVLGIFANVAVKLFNAIGV